MTGTKSQPQPPISCFRLLLCAVPLLLTGCASHIQLVVDAAGPQSGRIEGLFWFFIALLAAIFVIVIGLLLWTLTRRHRGIQQEPLERIHAPSAATENRLTRAVIGATTATVVILLGLLIASVPRARPCPGSAPKEQHSRGSDRESMVVVRPLHE